MAMSEKELVILRVSLLKMLRSLSANQRIIHPDHFGDVVMANLLGLVEFSREGAEIIDHILADDTVEEMNILFTAETGFSFRTFLIEYQRSIFENIGGKPFTFSINSYM